MGADKVFESKRMESGVATRKEDNGKGSRWWRDAMQGTASQIQRSLNMGAVQKLLNKSLMILQLFSLSFLSPASQSGVMCSSASAVLGPRQLKHNYL